jgi:hypothetical protein
MKTPTVPLSLRQKLSQVHINQITIALTFALSCIALATFVIMKDGHTIKTKLMGSCSHLEIAANVFASTPRYVAKSINSVLSHSLEGVKANAAKDITTTLTITKQVLIYILLRYQKVVQCIIYLSINAGTDLVAKNALEITEFVNRELSDISSKLSTGLNSINSNLQNINDASSSISFGSLPKIPLPVVIPGLTDPNIHWSLPNSTITTLQSLSQMPSLDTLHKDLSNLIGGPFDGLIQKIRVDLQSKFDLLNSTSINLPIPSAVDRISFCNGFTPSGSIDKLLSSLFLALCFYSGICILLGALVVVWEGMMMKRNHETMKEDCKIISESFREGQQVKIEHVGWIFWMMQYPRTHFLLNRIFGINVPNTFKEKIIVWYSSFVLHNPLTMMCLVVGSIGLVVVQFQLAILGWIMYSVAPVIVNDIENQAKMIQNSIQQSMDKAVGPLVIAINAENERIGKGE